MFSPSEVANNVINIGKTKTSYKACQLLLLGMLAGIFIALAAVGANTAGCTVQSASISKLVGACIFPAGLAMVLLAGSELFTGNCLIIVSVLEKEVTWKKMLRNWILVYVGNFIGSLFVAWAMCACGQLDLFGGALARTTISVAAGKASLSFGSAFLKGILGNFLVCIAVWISFAAKTVSGKIIGIFFPIMLFVLSGYEHSIANMYYIPAGLFAMMNKTYAASAADIATEMLTWKNFFINNLVPVTLGNIVGGAVLVGCIYWTIYLKKEK